MQVQVNIKIPRQSARHKKSKQKAKPKRLAHMAEVSIRFVKIELNPPSYMKDKEPVSVWIINVREDTPPEGVVERVHTITTNV